MAKITLDEKDYEDVQSAISWSGVNMTLEQAKQFAEKSEHQHDIAEWGADDTEVRSFLLNELSQELIGMSFPTYGDDEERRKMFHAKFTKTAQDFGYDVTE